MADTTNQDNPFSISEDTKERARVAIEDAFGTLTEHIKQIAEDFAEFDKQRQEMRRRMKNGARRTTGKFV